MKFIPFTVPSNQTVYLNPEPVVNVHTVFKSDAWAAGAKTVILYSDGYKVAVMEDVETVLTRLRE